MEDHKKTDECKEPKKPVAPTTADEPGDPDIPPATGPGQGPGNGE